MADNSFDILIEQANQAIQENNLEAALELLKTASAQKPDDAGVFTGIGKIYLQLGKIPDAVNSLQQAASLAPDSSDVFNNLGVAYMVAGQIKESETAYKKAVEISVANRQAWKNLALLYLQNEEKLLEGTQILIALLNLDPDDIEVILLLARIYEQGADLQSAKELYEKALKIDPGHPQITEALERIQKELTASDPQHIAKPEHAKKLSALKGLSKLKSDAPPAESDVKKNSGLN